MAKKTVYVTLNRSKNPQVSIRSTVEGENEMRWRKDYKSEHFEFVAIDDLPDSFVTTKETKKKINVTNDLSNGGKHEYTITVENRHGTFTSTEKNEGVPPAPGDKPVIRN